MKSTVSPAEKMRAVTAEVSGMLLERREQVQLAAIAILAKKMFFQKGLPGAAKSLLAREFCRRITDGRYFEVLLDRQMDKAELFGQYDIAKYDVTNVWERNVTGMLPDAEIVFLDEVFRAGPAVLNTLLMCMNERIFVNGASRINIPLVTAFLASNSYPDPGLEAFWDRITIRVETPYVRRAASFQELLHMQEPGEPKALITLPEVLLGVEEAARIPLSPDTTEQMTNLWASLNDEGIAISPRRWRDSVAILRASAYYRGADYTSTDDLHLLRHVLWNSHEEVGTVTNLVFDLAPEWMKTVNLLDSALNDMQTKLDEKMSKGDSAGAGSLAFEYKAKIGAARKQIIDLVVAGNTERTERLKELATDYRSLDGQIYTLLDVASAATKSALATAWADLDAKLA